MKKKLIIGISIGVVIIAIILIAIVVKSNSGKAFEVSVSEIQKNHFASIVSNDGVIEEVEKYEAYFDLSVKVKEILVPEYSNVKKGQKVLELDLDELNSQYAQAKVDKASIQLMLTKLKSSSAANNNGQYQNAVLAAQNNVNTAQSNYDKAKESYEKNMERFQDISISKEELDASKKAMDDAFALLQNAKLNYETAVSAFNDSKTGTYLDIKTSEQNLLAADLRLKNIEMKLQKLNEASVSNIDGVVTQMNVKKGGTIVVGQPAFVVVNPDILRVKTKVKEIDLKKVSVGKTVKIYGDAVDKALNVTGVVTSMSPVAKTSMTASGGDETDIEVIASINDAQNYKGILTAGLNVTCDIISKETDAAIVVSFETFLEDKDGKKFVYVVDKKNNIMKKRFVTIGGVSDLNAEVIQGLKAGEFIIDKPELTFKDGANVKIIEKNEEME